MAEVIAAERSCAAVVQYEAGEDATSPGVRRPADLWVSHLLLPSCCSPPAVARAALAALFAVPFAVRGVVLFAVLRSKY